MEIVNQIVAAIQSYGVAGLIGMSFAESSFFPIPPDVLLIPMCFLKPNMSLVYAFLATIASVFGGIFGYFIGAKLGKPILYKFFSEDKIKKVENYFKKYGAMVILIAGFTPIPYKLFTISAGVFGVSMPIFILSSILGRGGRFFLISIFIMLFGDTAKYYLNNYFEYITVGIGLLLIISYFLYTYFKKRKNLKINIFLRKLRRSYQVFYGRITKYKLLDKTLYTYFSAICICIFIMILYVDAFILSRNNIDIGVYNYFMEFKNSFIDNGAIFITSIGNPISIILLTLIVSLILMKKRKGFECVFFPLNILGVYVLNEVLKNIFKRVRPDNVHLVEASGYSFPSGHAMVFVTFALILTYYINYYIMSKRKKIVYTLLTSILIILVPLSRVYVGVHYFTDILAGVLSASIWFGAFLISNNYYLKLKKSKSKGIKCK